VQENEARFDINKINKNEKDIQAALKCKIPRGSAEKPNFGNLFSEGCHQNQFTQS
jgi:hypothetical protein